MTTTAPTGTVTFLFTDIEGSTRRWETEPDAMRVALATHDDVLGAAIETRGGWLFKHTGDGVCAAFTSARAAVDAAVDAQRLLELPVRMGIATGEAELRGDDYFGPALNRAARVMAAGHGQQVLVAASAASLAEGVELLDLGEYRLRDLSGPQRLFQVRADGLREVFPPLRTLDAAPGNLPAQTTSFLGRDQALTDVAAALETSRLVTLTGVGGVGKTRLAVQAAADVLPSYPEGAWLVELAAIGDTAMIGHAVAGAMGIAQQAGKTIGESLLDSLSGRRLLLVLDNCEHLIDGVAELAGAIIARCPRVTLLATSREALMVDGEQSWPVPSLGFRDGATSPAVELFVERARSVVPAFELGDDADAVSEICRRLDGIPLAIELAAARIRTMTPCEIASRLDERFRLLTGGARRSLERHQTLRHAVQWSFDLLTEPERAVLCRTAVFAGDFALMAAEHVCAGDHVEAFEILDLLDSLVRKSLVDAERTASGTRYHLLETIRQFSEEQLGASEDIEVVRHRHARYFADESDAMFEIWLSPRQREAYEWLDREMDNLRAAFRWAAGGGDTDIAIRIAADIGDLARFRFRYEAAEWASEVVGVARATRHRRLPLLLAWAASNGWAVGLIEEAKRYGEESISLRDDPEFEPFMWAFIDLAFIAVFEGNADRAVELLRTGAAHEADRHDRFCLVFMPYVTALAGRHAEAIKMVEEFTPTVEATGIPGSIAVILLAGGIALANSDPAAAITALERASQTARTSGNWLMESMIAPEMAALQARLGDPVAALHSFQQTLEGRRGSIDRIFVSSAFGGLVRLFERLGHAEAAAIVYGSLTNAFDSADWIQDLPEALARVQSTLGDPLFEESQQRGAALTLHEAADYAQEQIQLALQALGEDDG